MTDEESKYYYNMLKDEELLISFFNELSEMKIPDKITALNNTLKQEIQEIYIPSPVKFLYKNYNILEGCKFSNEELMEKIKEFEKSQGYTDLKTKKQLNIILEKIHDFTFRTATCRGYYFKDLKKHLIAYNQEMFEDHGDATAIDIDKFGNIIDV
jgi:hypothetical protein